MSERPTPLEKAPDELDLGDGHRIVFVDYEGEPRVGGYVCHPPVESICDGRSWITFEGRAWARCFSNLPSWKVESDDPLTISPSILCRGCGDHGHIRNGKWQRA